MTRRRGAPWRAPTHDLLVELVDDPGALCGELWLGVSRDHRVSRYRSAAGRCGWRWDGDCGGIATPQIGAKRAGGDCKETGPDSRQNAAPHTPAACFACPTAAGPTDLY